MDIPSRISTHPTGSPTLKTIVCLSVEVDELRDVLRLERRMRLGGDEAVRGRTGNCALAGGRVHASGRRVTDAGETVLHRGGRRRQRGARLLILGAGDRRVTPLRACPRRASVRLLVA